MSRDCCDSWCRTIRDRVITTGSCTRPTAGSVTENAQDLARRPGVGLEKGLEVQWEVRYAEVPDGDRKGVTIRGIQERPLDLQYMHAKHMIVRAQQSK